MLLPGAEICLAEAPAQEDLSRPARRRGHSRAGSYFPTCFIPNRHAGPEA